MADRKSSEPGAFVPLPGGAFLVRWDRPGAQEWSWMCPRLGRRFVGAYPTQQAAELDLRRAGEERLQQHTQGVAV
jgi:hypothetical protein